MPKKPKKRKPQLPAPEEFAARHAISIETARAILRGEARREARK